MIICSLTTIPKRLKSIIPILDSLLSQTVKATIIFINIPSYCKKTKETYNEDFIENVLKSYSPVIKILRCDDYGPITKLIPALDEIIKNKYDDNTLLITFDDDRIPNKYVIEMLKNKIDVYRQKEKRVALSFSGWRVGKHPFKFQLYTNVSTDTKVDWVQGTDCIALYGNMTTLLGNMDTKLGCPDSLDTPKNTINSNHVTPQQHDDHLIAYALQVSGIDRIVIPNSSNSKLFERMNTSVIDSISFRPSFIFEVEKICENFEEMNIYGTENYGDKQYFKHYTKSIKFNLTLCIVLATLLIFPSNIVN